MSVVDTRPWVDVKMGGGPEQGFLLDTGAMMTARSTSGAVGIQPVNLKVFGLTFLQLKVAALNIFPLSTPCKTAAPAGLVGGDILRWFRVILTYPARLAEIQNSGGEGIKAPDATVPLMLAGGGVAVLPGGAGETVNLHDALPLLANGNLKVEGRSVTALLDTGATFSLIKPSLLQTLGGSGRPDACCFSVNLAGRAPILARLTRLKTIQVGGAETRSEAALVLADTRFWSDLAASLGREVELILGGSYLRQFKVDMDYPARTLRLGKLPPYWDVEWSEFTYPGFTFCRSASEDALAVLDVFTGTEADKAGIKSGGLIIAVNGKLVGSQTAADIRASLRKVNIGAQVTVTLKGGAIKKVRMEQLLPEYK